MKKLIFGILAYLGAVTSCLAQLQGSGVPYFPQTLPAQTLVGRYSSTPGPTEAIPFSLFYSAIGTAVFAQSNTWSANQTFTANLLLRGSTSGTVTFKPAAVAGTWTFSLPPNAGTAGMSMATDGAGIATWAWPQIAIGSNVISGGTTGRVLYDNAGVAGEYSISGSGNVAMTTSAALTTPTITTATLAGLTTYSGHQATSGSAPALTSCGTSPTIAGTDTAGLVTMGTASPTGCVITFASAYTTAPYCNVSWLINIASMQFTVSTTAITLVQTGTSSNKVMYRCTAPSGG